MKSFTLLISSLAIIQMATAGDPGILSDCIIPANVTIFDGLFFTFTGMRALVTAGPPTTFKVSKASLAEFPALNGQCVS
nr:putative germin-like protein 9-2 [Quercus suber]